MKFTELVADALQHVDEWFPWDLEERLQQNPELLMVDIREASEYEPAHIKGSILAPRGILESCCDWGYVETIPELAQARDKEVILICRSGNRSVLAARTLQLMGYQNVWSLKTGIKGWNDSDLPLTNIAGDDIDGDWAETFLNPPVDDDKLQP